MNVTPPTSIAGTSLLQYLSRELEKVNAQQAELQAQIAAFPQQETLDGDDLAAWHRLAGKSVALQPHQHRIGEAILLARRIVTELAFLNLPDPVALAVAEIQRVLATAQAEKDELDALPDWKVNSDTEIAQNHADDRIEACNGALKALTDTPEPVPADQLIVAAQAIQQLAGETARRAYTLDSRAITTDAEDTEREQLYGAQRAYIASLRALITIDPAVQASTRPDLMADMLAEIEQINTELDTLTDHGKREPEGVTNGMRAIFLRVQRETWEKAMSLLTVNRIAGDTTS